jgi:hypothetical protein
MRVRGSSGRLPWCRAHVGYASLFGLHQGAKGAGLHGAEAWAEQSQNHGQVVMKLSRIWFAFPWRIALILALLPCLPLLSAWAWLRWEGPPLQRYYLAAYWHSFEHANQPDARTQIRWLMETVPGVRDSGYSLLMSPREARVISLWNYVFCC